MSFQPMTGIRLKCDSAKVNQKRHWGKDDETLSISSLISARQSEGRWTASARTTEKWRLNSTRPNNGPPANAASLPRPTIPNSL